MTELVRAILCSFTTATYFKALHNFLVPSIKTSHWHTQVSSFQKAKQIRTEEESKTARCKYLLITRLLHFTCIWVQRQRNRWVCFYSSAEGDTMQDNRDRVRLLPVCPHVYCQQAQMKGIWTVYHPALKHTALGCIVTHSRQELFQAKLF